MGRLRPALAGVSGFVVWTAVEYLTHRFVFHGPKRPRIMSTGHRMHHRHPMATSPVKRVAGHLAVAGAVSPMYLAGRTPTRLGAWLGFTIGYSTYETTHWRMHHMPDTVAVQRRLHHEIHHSKSRYNFGVTTDVWDSVFDTAHQGAETGWVPSAVRASPSWLPNCWQI